MARVALTFDAEFQDKSGSSASNIFLILHALADFEVPATFFVQGRWANAYPLLARDIISPQGPKHAVGSHGFYHAPSSFLTHEGFHLDVQAAAAALETVMGVDTVLFRHPFGIETPIANQVLDDLGYQPPVFWDTAGVDWDSSIEEVTNNVLGTDDPGIILLHTWPNVTASALPTILSELKARGSEFYTLGDD